ncbi:RIP metalloprotease RseP [Pseudothauera nasutitermitis]|uniref:Zinc metalloprotease n=1 Tax=Pseudothauera nasutitermitis TaxID=2565930 RepID=A0A4V3WC87_9RHOO|nr:RIP metalloprotease RseP [Pseudothauera nasutitermitis]THF66218.1 RIP metalloprotease RseP [Pseudothauera nasutitermitis]
MNLFDYLIPFVAALGLLILIHELGHYLVARWCGVKVLRFSIGFGKPLVAWRAGRDRTEWALAAFPLGGYVKMLDEREGEVPADELHRAFNRQSVYRRFAIVAAGPLANFLLAIVVYWALFVGGVEELRPRLALMDGPSIAASAGVQDGDLVTAVDGQSVRSWQDLRWALLRHALDARQVHLQVRTAEGVEATRTLDLAGVAIEADEDLVVRIGLLPWRPLIDPVIGQLMPGGAAERAGLREGDRFILLGGEPLDSWTELVSRVRESAGEALPAVVERAGQEIAVTLLPEVATESGERVGRIGVAVARPAEGERDALFAVVRYGPFDGLGKAVRQTWETSVLSLRMIGRMITGDVSWKNLSGPVTIADYAGQTAQLGWSHYLRFVALISISLGVLNLLPIPVLDGGHLMYYTIEILKGGPVPERVMEIGQQVGLVLLAMLMAFAFYNDISRLVSG